MDSQELREQFEGWFKLVDNTLDIVQRVRRDLAELDLKLTLADQGNPGKQQKLEAACLFAQCATQVCSAAALLEQGSVTSARALLHAAAEEGIALTALVEDASILGQLILRQMHLDILKLYSWLSDAEAVERADPATVHQWRESIRQYEKAYPQLRSRADPINLCVLARRTTTGTELYNAIYLPTGNDVVHVSHGAASRFLSYGQELGAINVNLLQPDTNGVPEAMSNLCVLGGSVVKQIVKLFDLKKYDLELGTLKAAWEAQVAQERTSPENTSTAILQPERVPDQYKLMTLLEANTQNAQLPDQSQHPGLMQVRQVFQRNVDRVMAMCRMPVDTASFAYQLAYAQATARIPLGLSMGGPVPTPLAWQHTQAMQRALNEQMSYLERGAGIGLAFAINGSRIIDEISYLLVPIFQNGPPYAFRQGVETLLPALLIAEWTAFEAMVEDLWAAAIELRPDKYPTHNVSGTTIADPAQLTAAARAAVLRAMRREFGRIEGAAQMYRYALGQPARDVFDKHPKVYLADALRNLFVHQGGVVDARFLAKSAVVGSRFATLQVGTDVTLSTDEVKELCEELIVCATEVFKVVDGLLVAY